MQWRPSIVEENQEALSLARARAREEGKSAGVHDNSRAKTL